MAGILKERGRGRLDTQRQREEGYVESGQRLELCCHKLGTTWAHRTLEEVRKESPLECLDGTWASQNLDSRLLASRTERKKNAVLNHKIGGNL